MSAVKNLIFNLISGIEKPNKEKEFHNLGSR